MLRCKMMAEQERWSKEQEFFDAEEYDEGPLPPETVARYMACRKPYLPAEYPFWALGDVRGKRVLELGCGDGGNAVLLALKGATVVGIDISVRAIDVARNRARLHGVSDRTEFYALPLESYLEQQPTATFDIICGFAVLHHLLPVLDEVMRDLKKLAGEHTAFLFVEPVSLSRWLRRLRLALPVKVHGTPDERPLEPRDLMIVRRHLPQAQMRLSGCLLRLWNRYLVGRRYEDFSKFAMALFDGLARIDAAILRAPILRTFASSAVIHSGLPPSGT